MRLWGMIVALGLFVAACGDGGGENESDPGDAGLGEAGTSGGGTGGSSLGGAGGNAGGNASVGGTSGVFVTRVSTASVDKVDLLFMIDNSVSMADKQQILRDAVPDLVGRLVSPTCVDANGEQAATQPAGAAEPCPEGYGREFQPIVDINIGIITSSLGGFGAREGYAACSDPNYIDMAHLLGALPRGEVALGDSTYRDENGFLKWRTGDSRQSFQTDFQNLVGVAGEQGCGYEASLEAWYRFLIDPEPYQTLESVSCSGGTDTNCIAPTGIDQELLDQRAAFLRPDSLVAIVMLTDENDCSMRIGSQTWVAADTGTTLYRPSSVCEADPDGACCYTCGTKPPMGCTADPNCGDPNDTGESTDLLETSLDSGNLRCFHQKQRFGIDFLYPTARYANALAQSELCLERPDLAMTSGCSADRTVPNPLYRSSASVTVVRGPSMVYLAGIVGVPWQDLAVDPIDSDALAYKTFATLDTDHIWDVILGDGITPGDPLMRESIAPRAGSNPITNDPLAPPDATNPLANPINGHEWDISRLDDLQYACIFPLKTPIDCSTVGNERGCNCKGDGAAQNNSPLCQASDGSYSPLQHYAKAYPAIRQLQVLKEFGDLTGNSVVASICARNVTDDTRQDYGYRPAIGAIVDRLKEHLGDRCLPRQLPADASGQLACGIIEATLPPSGESCSCTGSARQVAHTEHEARVRQEMAQEGYCGELNADGVACSDYCLCEVPQLSGDAADDCRNNETPAASTNGWCYIDLARELGNPALVFKCPATSKRKLRFVGQGEITPGALSFLACP